MENPMITRIFELFDDINHIVDEHGNDKRETHPHWDKNGENPAFSWLGFHESQDSEQISRDQMKEALRVAIEKQLKASDRVYLYYCPDNALISIDNPDDDDSYDQDSEIPQLYIGWD